MKEITLEKQRKRLENINYAANAVKKCQKRMRIHDYLPGQVTYNLGPYPARFSIEPTEYDYNLIKSFAESGVGLIQIHEEWNDYLRRFGADKYSSHDPQGMKNFIKLCHDFGIKIIPYMSTSYLEVNDPDFTMDFMRYEWYLNGTFWKYASCSAKSPQWTTYLLNKLRGLLEEYDFDGLYDDTGSEEFAKRDLARRHKDNVITSWRDMKYDPEEEDLLARVYALTKEKNGIFKLHYGLNTLPRSDEKLYDYLWVGESVSDGSDMLDTASFPPYVVPCPDFSAMNSQSDRVRVYARSLPFLQFPLRTDGRPYQAGKIIGEPDIKYTEGGTLDYYRKMAEYDKEHPNGPYAYSDWSAIPDDEEYRRLWFHYLELYRPMVEENNICHMNVQDSTVTMVDLPDNVYMSMFTGDEVYLCLSNLSEREHTIMFEEKWENRETGEISDTVTIPVDGLCFLRKI
ncbi:MAG: hypothetical protein J6B23_05765 [Clostridia bacterium]|nr:hypothetical protein [Clostridia bacterium]